MWRRIATRMPPPRLRPARICRSAGISWASCRRTKSVPWRDTRMWCSRSTGRSSSRRSRRPRRRPGANSAASYRSPSTPSRGARHRGGAAPEQLAELADLVAGAPGLRIGGLMTVAPLAGPYAGREQAAFERLVELSSRLRADHPTATMVSAGMSADLEQAVAAGATHVRVGTAVLGARPRLG